jgi:hypothetical protein
VPVRVIVVHETGNSENDTDASKDATIFRFWGAQAASL